MNRVLVVGATGQLGTAGANLMGMNWIVGSVDTCYDMKTIAPMFGISLTTVEQFLRHKLSLPSE